CGSRGRTNKVYLCSRAGAMTAIESGSSKPVKYKKSESCRKRYCVSLERVASRALGIIATDFWSMRRMNSVSCGRTIEDAPLKFAWRLGGLIVTERSRTNETPLSTLNKVTGLTGS